MASARLRRRDRQLESLVKENVKLHEDVRELEDAYQLHRHHVEQDRNSVHGLIRNELGGSRWQHGGTGKLTTYKSSKDLIDNNGTRTPDKHVLTGSREVNNVTSTNPRVERKSTLDNDDNRRVKLLDELKNASLMEDVKEDKNNENKILDLKTKVLKKASSKIIRRDTWAGPSDVKEKTGKKVSEAGSQDKLDYKSVLKTKQKDSIKPKGQNNSLVKTDSAKSAKQNNLSEVSQNKHHTEEVSVRRSRLDIHESSKKSATKQGVSHVTDTAGNRVKLEDLSKPKGHQTRTTGDMKSLVLENNFRNSAQYKYQTSDSNEPTLRTENDVLDISLVGRLNNGLNLQTNIENVQTVNEEALERHLIVPKSVDKDAEGSEPVKKDSTQVETRVFQTESLEPTEIYIDTESGQIRVRSGEDNSLNSLSNPDGTKVLIQQRPINKSMDGQRLPCTIVEDNNTLSGQQEVRDIFGLYNNEAILNGPAQSEMRTYGTSVSPFALVKDCNTEVEFWLHGLGLPDVDKYIKIFADHEIDLLDLEFMTAAQLHDMGVTAIGALDKILKGVKDLRSGVKSKVPSDRSKSGTSKHLQLSSIAWEETDNENSEKVKKKMSETGLSRQNSGKVVNNETFIHSSSDMSNTMKTNRSDVRLSSAMSVHSDCGESVSSSRTKPSNTLPSFSASTMASTAKCIDKRPPSSKLVSQTKGRSQQKSQGKLKKNDSNVTEKSALKLAQMEGKPTRGVLIRPRSSSLSREVTPKQQGKKEKEEKEVKSRNLRYRSRSVDAVKRKAMEGVQSAAKKFEEKQQRDRENKQPVYHRDEKMKARRNEMAARHQQREKHREFVHDQSSDTEEDVCRKEDSGRKTDSEDGLGSLVTVNILSQSGPVKSPLKDSPLNDNSTVNSKTDVRKSLRRVEPARRPGSKSQVKPVELQLSAAKMSPVKPVGIKVQDQEKSPRSQSEPESGYKTDGSTSYSQIEDRVSEIQKKIKRLKTHASSGDELTGTLVQDLQAQLQQFEHILGTRNKGGYQETPGKTGSYGEEIYHSDLSDRQSRPGLRRSWSMGANDTSPKEDFIDEDQTQIKEHRVRDDDVVRMSKRELLDEMRKEKKHHHLQIRQLQKELERIRHADPVTSMEIQLSDILYREEDMIGEGTFSQVYKGLYQGSEVAVKKLKVPLRPQDRNYFTAELSLLKELRHPRVVLLIGVCTTDKHPVMVLEYMSRGSLYNYLHDPKNESFDHALYFQVARDITAGMKYLHSHRPEVIHLDLKSMNVLLCQSFRAKIADFGFSKLRHDAGIKSKGKTRQTNISSPAWMSPELLNKGEVTTKTDVYSFAIILWEMLTRKEPYWNQSVFQILERVRRNKRPEIPISAPDGLQLLITQCWDPNPAKRPQFKDILQLLENLEFPPAWRELFKKAGVPDEALSNIQSTRNIIKLVTETLDLPGPPNFMLMNTPRVHSEREKQSATALSSRSVSKNAVSQVQKKGNLDSQREVTSERDNWESETVTTLSGSEMSSDESDITLKNLKESTSEESVVSSVSSDDEQSVTSSDMASTVLSAGTHRAQRRPVNVFVPNLELSIESARKEFVAERDRISRISWLSISLDDRTERSLEGQSGKMENAEKNVNSETSLNLLSNRSSISSTPSGVAIADSGNLNESARRRRRDKNTNSMDSSDEYFMRESFNNRRPPSPKKRRSLTKKLMDKSLNLEGNSARSEPSDMRIPPSVQTGSMSDRGIRVTGNVESSYDSFFGIPAVTSQASSIPNNYDVNMNPHTDINIHSDTLCKPDVKLDLGTKTTDISVDIKSDRKKNSVRRSDMYIVDKETDSMSSDRSQSQSDLVTEVKKHLECKSRLSKPNTMDKIVPSDSVDISYTHSSENISNNADSSRSNDFQRSRQDSFTEKRANINGDLFSSNKYDILEASRHIDGNHGIGINEKHGLSSEFGSSVGSKYTRDLKPSNLQSGIMDTRNVPIRKNLSPEVKSTSLDNFGGSKLFEHSRKTSHSVDVESRIKVMDTKSVKKVQKIKQNDMKDSVTKQQKQPDDQIIEVPVVINKSTEIKHDGGEQIRVVLNPKDVKDKQKPAITPRKSKMKIIDTKSENTWQETKQEIKVNSENNFVQSLGNVKEAGSELKTVKQKENSEKTLNLGKSGITPVKDKPKMCSDKVSHSAELVEAYKKPTKSNKIRVKLRKDPLATKFMGDCPSSPVPPPPPPPPVLNLSAPSSTLSKSMQMEAPRLSMADELKSRINQRQSISEGMKLVRKSTGNTSKPVKPENVIGTRQDSSINNQTDKSVATVRDGEPSVVKMNTSEDLLAPQQSEGLPSFVVQSLELKDQKDHLRSISKPHPKQLDDLSGASQEQLSSIADILRKAVMGRRLAMGEDADSVSQSFDSVATGWSVDLN